MDANYFHERRIKEARLRDHFSRHISEVLTDIRQMMLSLVLQHKQRQHELSVSRWLCVGADYGED